MPRTLRDGYSNFKFFQAMLPQAIADPPGAGGTEGISIDTKGFDTVTFIFNVGATTAGNGAFDADDFHQLMLEHYNSAAAAWSECYPSQMIHSVVGMGGAYSTLDSGIFQSIASFTDCSAVYWVGYKGPHRFCRVRLSGEVTPSIISVAAIAICGLAGDWPVSEPVGD